MNRGENEFDPLERWFGSSRRGLGPCPSAEVLAGFAAQSLEPDEADRIRAHVSMCGVCDSLVEGLRRFDDPVTETPLGWAATERRLRARVFPRPRRLWLLHPAVAYGISLAAVIVAVIAVRHPPSERPASPTMVAPRATELQSVRMIDLNNTRGAGVPRFTLGSGDRFAILSFLIDIHPAFHYEASLDGRTAQAVASSDGKGNFAVLVSRDLLGAGPHCLTVAEINPASGKVERSLDFHFQL